MLHLTIVTQEKELLSIEVDSITAMTTSGEVTILSGHIPLMTKLTDTEFVYRVKGQEQSLAITGGFMNVEPGNKVIVLADAAVRSEDIDEARAQEARKKAYEATQNDKLSTTEMRMAEGELRRAILELKVAAKRRKNL
jgi:F-type H+-transporting ATPase subunit epsilon